MHSNLVRAPRLRQGSYERKSTEPLHDLEPCFGCFPFREINDRPVVSAAIGTQGKINFPYFLFRLAMYDGKINLVNLTRGKSLVEISVGALTSGIDKDTGRVLIDPMHWQKYPKLLGQQFLGDRDIGVPAIWDGQHSRRLVDRKDFCIYI